MAALATLVNARAEGSSKNWPTALAKFVANDHAVSAAGGAIAVTLSADADRPNVIRQIFASYDATPAAGSTVTIEDGSGTTVWKQAITAAGPVIFTFDPPKTGTKNTAMIITLSAGGGSILAYLDVNAYREQ